MVAIQEYKVMREGGERGGGGGGGGRKREREQRKGIGVVCAPTTML